MSRTDDASQMRATVPARSRWTSAWELKSLRKTPATESRRVVGLAHLLAEPDDRRRALHRAGRRAARHEHVVARDEGGEGEHGEVAGGVDDDPVVGREVAFERPPEDRLAADRAGRAQLDVDRREVRRTCHDVDGAFGIDRLRVAGRQVGSLAERRPHELREPRQRLVGPEVGAEVAGLVVAVDDQDRVPALGDDLCEEVRAQRLAASPLLVGEGRVRERDARLGCPWLPPSLVVRRSQRQAWGVEGPLACPHSTT